MKKTPRWSFEKNRLRDSGGAMFILSWGIAFSTVPHLASVYFRAGITPVLMIFVFGLIWGLGNLLFGAGICLIGISFTFPICIGLSTALVSLIPMSADPKVFLTSAGATITLGIVVLLGGVLLCAIAGIRMNAQSTAQTCDAGESTTSLSTNTLWKGLLIVILSGLCDPFLNFAFTFGERVLNEAKAA